MDREKVIKGIDICLQRFHCGEDCPYYNVGCMERLREDALAMLKEQEEERKRMISWLGKFCRHIDNGDKWLSDKENIAFFRKKMEQQFGWDS